MVGQQPRNDAGIGDHLATACFIAQMIANKSAQFTLQEAVKWGQPSYLTTESKSGSTIRIDQVKTEAGRYAVYFHCQTDLVETFRELYPELSYGGNRSILLDAGEKLPEAALRHCVALALTYHLRKRKAAK